MSAIQELTPFLERFTEHIRNAKDEKRFTIDSIVELSGLSVSTVTKVVSGAQNDPKLSTAAAICQVLALSLDEVTGVVPPVPPSEALLQHIHELELQGATKDGQLTEAHARLKSIQPLVYCLCSLCIVLTMCTTAYLLGDSQHPEIGLIRFGEVSAPAWFLIGVIVASVGTTALLVYRVLRQKKES